VQALAALAQAAPGHVIRPGDEPVQRHRDIRDYLAHVSIPLSQCLHPSVRSGGAPARYDGIDDRSSSEDYADKKIEYIFTNLNGYVVDSGLVVD
jgi:hypothetical protein